MKYNFISSCILLSKIEGSFFVNNIMAYVCCLQIHYCPNLNTKRQYWNYQVGPNLETEFSNTRSMTVNPGVISSNEKKEHTNLSSSTFCSVWHQPRILCCKAKVKNNHMACICIACAEIAATIFQKVFVGIKLSRQILTLK